MKKIVFVPGVFDLMHYGHENLLKKAREYGNYVVVGLISNEGVLLKNKVTSLDEDERYKLLKESGLADKVILTDSTVHSYRGIYKDWDVDVHLVGNDHKGTPKAIELEKDGKLVFVDRTPGISSSLLREKTKEQKVGKTVITYGTFDYLHEGHINIIKRSAALGDNLIVGVSADKFNEIKGKPNSKFNEDERMKMVSKLECVDQVILEKSWDQKSKDFSEYSVDTFVMGGDWEGKFDYFNNIVEVKYLDRTPGVSSTELRKEDKDYK